METGRRRKIRRCSRTSSVTFFQRRLKRHGPELRELLKHRGEAVRWVEIVRRNEKKFIMFFYTLRFAIIITAAEYTSKLYSHFRWTVEKDY